ncbi:Protein CBG24377 [Caenorhabditis briggsae]|uniref:Protein CBG24377 n=1 Tax=Caenorhabditis briggsae TaxID=6238 RepID=A8WKK5_CAEBR|nr:Protein CBG24377 [Caenorhabditis briggsae]CAP21000.1 Protein CBG24377 [Caenorhabditis briggsae]
MKVIWKKNVKQFTVYKGVSCFNQDLCAVIIDARVGLGAAVRMSPEPHFLKNLYMTEDSKMTVYTGTISPDHQVAQYTKPQYSNVDQKFHGVFTTYTLDQNIAIAYLSSDRLDTNWTSITDGRTGIFASKNYGVVSKDQNIQEAFSGASTDIFEMTLNTKSSGLTDRATLTVTVTSGGKSVFDEKYTSQRFPPATITANGNGLIVKYDTNGSETTGMLMDFSFKLEMSGGCADTQTINPPANISNSISYPSNWQTSNDAPQYAANQNCTFTVNIPKGMFVFLQMKATTDPSSVLIMTDSAGYQNILYQVVANGNRFVSSGKYLTLWSLVPGFSNIGNSVIIQDYFAGWATAVDSRRGFFMSPNYALNSSDQNINDTVSGFSSTSNISYTVDRSAISGAATLNVLITSKQKVVVNNTFSTTNFPGGTEWTVGDTISVIYNSNGVSTTGAFVSFGFDHYNSGTTNDEL